MRLGVKRSTEGRKKRPKRHGERRTGPVRGKQARAGRKATRGEFKRARGAVAIPLVMGVGGAMAGKMAAGALMMGPTGTSFMAGIGFMVGSMIGNMLFPQDQKTEMPPVAEYPIQQTAKGLPVPILFGTRKAAGNVIWKGPLDAYTIKHKTSGGGKGGGGGSVTTTEVRYRLSFLIAVCEGPAYIRRLWEGKTEREITECTWFDGDGDDTTLNALLGEDYANYKNTACALFESWELGNSQAIPNFNFEVSAETVKYTDTLVTGNSNHIVYDQDFAFEQNIGSGSPSSGCDVDRDGNMYVGTVASPAELRKYDKNGNLLWTVSSGIGLAGIRGIRVNHTATMVAVGGYDSGGGTNSTLSVLSTADGSVLAQRTTDDTPSGPPDYGPKRPGGVYDFVWDADDNLWIPNYGNWRQTPGYYSPGKFSGADLVQIRHYSDLTPKVAFTYGCAINETRQLVYNASSGSNFVTLGIGGGYGVDAGSGGTVYQFDPGASHHVYGVAVIGDAVYFCGPAGTAPLGSGVANVWKLTYDLSSVEAEYNCGGATWTAQNVWVTRHGDIGVMTRNPSSGKIEFFVLDPEDLSLISQTTTTQAASTTTGVRGNQLVASVLSDPFDENPSRIIQEIMTNTRWGAGIPESMIDEESFEEIYDYCEENDFLISVLFDQQQSAKDMIAIVCSHFGGYWFFSDGKYHLGAYRSQAAAFALTVADLKASWAEDGEPPVKCQKRPYSDTYNRIEVTWTNRDKEYDTSVAIANDEVDQRISGQVRKRTYNMGGIHGKTYAQRWAYRMLFENMYRFSTFSFPLGYSRMLLEPGDVGTLSDGGLISGQLLRITKIQEAEHGSGLAVEAREEPAGVYELVGMQGEDTLHEEDDAASLGNSRVAFREDQEQPLLYLSVSPTTADCNGWFIYRSYDGSSYDFVGRTTIDGVTGGSANSRGTIQTGLPAHAATAYRADETILVDVGTITDLADASSDDAFFSGRHILRLGEEIIGYRYATETATAGVWEIRGLIRGMFATEAAAHAPGETLSTLAVDFTYMFRPEDIGTTLYFKAVAFYANESYDISDATAYSQEVKGEYQRPAAPAVARLTEEEVEGGGQTYSGSSFTLYWTLPALKGSGYNQGGFDLNSSYPIWRYGDQESELTGGDGVAFGNAVADADMQSIDLVFEQTDGTFISERSVDPTDESATITKATDLGGLATAVCKIYARKALRSQEAAAITVTAV